MQKNLPSKVLSRIELLHRSEITEAMNRSPYPNYS